MQDRLKAALRLVDAEECVALAQRLVQVPSLSGHEGHQIAQVMAEWLRHAGIDAAMQELDPERANVYASVAGVEPGPRLLLNGHLDTVPVDGMSIQPFAGNLDGGRLWGRGAADMKAALAAQMVALKAIRQSRVPFRGELWFGSEAGEDGGGWRLADLLSPGPVDCDLAVVGEPTELELHSGCCGGFRFHLETSGKSVHTGMAERGVNAILAAARCIPLVYELACFSERDPVWGKCPVNVQEIRGGGIVDRSVPDSCVATFDIRLTPGVSIARARLELEEALAQARVLDPQLRVDWKFYAPPKEATFLDPAHPFVASVSEAIQRVTGSPPKPGVFRGGSAASELMKRGIPTVIYGPGSAEQAHAPSEWVDVEQVVIAARAYVAIALRVLETPSS